VVVEADIERTPEDGLRFVRIVAPHQVTSYRWRFESSTAH
jgi:hypothetical protein